MQIKAIGLTDIEKTLKTLENKTAEIQPLLKELANHLQNTVEESFETQTSPDGKKWNPIKKAMHKNYKLGTSKILYRTGHMQGSLQSRVYKKSLTVGLNATSNSYLYPLVHQFGNKKKSGRGSGIVARPFMPIKANGEIYNQTQKELEEILSDYLKFLD